MAVSSVVAFWGVAVLLIIVPGADWAFVLGSGLRGDTGHTRHSGHTAVPAVGGLVIGYAAITAVVASGVGALVARSPSLLSGLTIVGGVYLMWHGARTLARPTTPDISPGTGQGASTGHGASAGHGASSGHGTDAGTDADGRTGTRRATLARGVGVSTLNPKGLLIFLALLPQFTSPRWSWPLPAQLGLLGLVFTLSCAAFYLCLGSFASRILQARPAAAGAVTRFSGAAMIVIGALLLIERLVAR